MTLPTENPIVMKRISFHLKLRKVLQHLEEHMSQPVHLKDAAAVACMEKTAFSRFFSHSVGMSFHEFLLAWRVRKAIDLMTTSDCTLSEISDAVGFETLVNLERAFKKLVGCAPSRYRKRIPTDRSLWPRNCGSGRGIWGRERCTSSRGALGRTATVNP
jgi:AraC-like DNA-binding protein